MSGGDRRRGVTDNLDENFHGRSTAFPSENGCESISFRSLNGSPCTDISEFFSYCESSRSVRVKDVVVLHMCVAPPHYTQASGPLFLHIFDGLMLTSPTFVTEPVKESNRKTPHGIPSL